VKQQFQEAPPASVDRGTIREIRLGFRPWTDPIPDSPMVPAIDARWSPCRGENGM